MSIENKRKIRFNNSVLVGRAPDVDRRMKDKESGFYSHLYKNGLRILLAYGDHCKPLSRQ